MNVVTFKKEEIEEPKSFIRITQDDYIVETLEADSFGSSQEMPDFTVFWTEEPYQLIRFMNNRYIRKIEVVEENEKLATM